MVYYAAFVFGIVAIIAVILEKKLFNPLTIFSGIWAMLTMFQSLGLFQLYETEDWIYSLIIIGEVSFAVGYALFRKGKLFSKRIVFTNKSRWSPKESTFVLRRQYVYMACIICILFYLIDLGTLLPSIISGGLSEVRAICQDPDGIVYNRRSGIENAIRTLFVGPVAFAMLPITAVDFFKTRKDKKLLFLCAAIIVLRVITEGGRSVVAYFMLHIVLAFVLKGKKKALQEMFGDNLQKIGQYLKKRKYMVMGVVALVVIGGVALYFTTLARSGSDAAIHMYFYVAMQGKMFEIWAKRVDMEHLYGFGIASLNGFVYPIIYFIKNIFGFSDFPGYWGKIVNMIQATDSEWQWMSGYGRANAFVSLFWFFYLDGRTLGMVIGMFVYGMVSAKAYKNALDYPNDKNLCFCMLIMQGLLFSMVRLQFANVFYALAFVYIALFYKKIRTTV